MSHRTYPHLPADPRSRIPVLAKRAADVDDLGFARLTLQEGDSRPATRRPAAQSAVGDDVCRDLARMSLHGHGSEADPSVSNDAEDSSYDDLWQDTEGLLSAMRAQVEAESHSHSMSTRRPEAPKKTPNRPFYEAVHPPASPGWYTYDNQVLDNYQRQMDYGTPQGRQRSHALGLIRNIYIGPTLVPIAHWDQQSPYLFAAYGRGAAAAGERYLVLRLRSMKGLRGKFGICK
ncbi:hypothetical protein C8F01DRAFT_1231618 [Mycena amicta]|nr:hypothetical protein C8F01DRAFT_1231618 [Mycena amicta]